MAAVIRENVDHSGVAGWDLITLTPPGARDLPWDTATCNHRPGLACSGERGCRIHPDALAVWHRSFRPRFEDLLRAAKQAARRRGHRTPRFIAVLEPQARGAIHVHLASPSTDRPAARAVFEHLERRATAYGFGRRVAWDPARGRDHAERRGIGAYITKLTRYLAKEADGHQGGLREVLAAMPRRRVFSVSTKLTTASGATMRTCRRRRYLYAIGASGLTCHQARELFDRIKLVEAGELAALRARAPALPPPPAGERRPTSNCSPGVSPSRCPLPAPAA